MAKKEGALFGATRPVPSAELKSGETRFTDHFFVISLLLHTLRRSKEEHLLLFFPASKLFENNSCFSKDLSLGSLNCNLQSSVLPLHQGNKT